MQNGELGKDNGEMTREKWMMRNSQTQSHHNSMTSTLENTTTQPVFSIRPKPEPYGFWGDFLTLFFSRTYSKSRL